LRAEQRKAGQHAWLHASSVQLMHHQPAPALTFEGGCDCQELLAAGNRPPGKGGGEAEGGGGGEAEGKGWPAPPAMEPWCCALGIMAVWGWGWEWAGAAAARSSDRSTGREVMTSAMLSGGLGAREEGAAGARASAGVASRRSGPSMGSRPMWL
jgi:hypothetical protein